MAHHKKKKKKILNFGHSPNYKFHSQEKNIIGKGYGIKEEHVENTLGILANHMEHQNPQKF